MNARDRKAYATLADRLHAPNADHGTAPIVRGEAAAAEGQRLLMLATETNNIDDAIKVALGRPRLDSGAPGPLWKVRATKALDQKVRLIAERTGVTRSEVIRNAVAAYSG